VRKQWYPGSSLPAEKTVDHDALLGSIMDTLRHDTRLAFLDGQLYPNLQKVARSCFQDSRFATAESAVPRDYNEFRAAFYFCKRLIQFMQQVYYDRQLDTEYAAPRNRGWMNLFRRWSWSRMLRFTWTMTAGTYGARFQSFCEHRLSLESGEPKFSDRPLQIDATVPGDGGQPELTLVAPPGTAYDADFDWADTERVFGLHHYETRLIREFVGAYVRREDLQSCPQPFRFEVYPLRVATDDVIDEQADRDMELNAGILIAGPAARQADCGPRGCRNAILYFRIRPSMRNMDLARKAFLECRRHDGLKTYPIELVDELPQLREETKPAWQRRAYREVHYLERESVDRCRWFSQLLEEVAEQEAETS
jgi:hypothetical protein